MSSNIEKDFLQLFRYFYNDSSKKIKFEEFEKKFQDAVGTNRVTFSPLYNLLYISVFDLVPRENPI